MTFVYAQENDGVDWNETSATSTGGSATIYLPKGATSLKIRVTKPCTKYDFELIVTTHRNWRDNQVAAYLSSGGLYTSYGSQAPASPIPIRSWGETGSVASVTVDYDRRVITFYCNEVTQAVFALELNDVFLGIRVHHGGAINLIQ